MLLLSRVAVFIAFLLASVAASADDCSGVLNTGFMTKDLIEKTAASRSTFNSWMCSTDFGTHQEARDAGISLGVPVYDVPLQATGTFTSEQKAEWKKTHCEATSSTAESASTYRRLLQYFPTAAYTAWVDCKRVSAYGVSCWFEIKPDDWKNLVFRARWNPVDGDKGELPEIRDGAIAGAQPADGKEFLVGKRTLDANFAILLARTTDGDSVAAMMNTSRGACNVFAPPHPPVLETVFETTNPETGQLYTRAFTFEKNDHMKYGDGGRGTWIRYSNSAPGPIYEIKGSGRTGEGCGWVDDHQATADGSTFNYVGSTNSGAPCAITYTVYYKVAREKCVKYCGS